MSVIILKNNLNPSITRQFPKRAWEVLDKSSKLKQEWSYSHSLTNDGEPVQSEAPNKVISFVPPEVVELQAKEAASKEETAKEETLVLEKPKTRPRKIKQL
jgi:hypothetical protein